MQYRSIHEDQARAVLVILRDVCGYAPDAYTAERFVRDITARGGMPWHEVCQEYRFCGALGFGGKFRNNGNNGNTPYVDCYPEHETPERRAMIDKANLRIAAIFNTETEAAPA